MSNLFEIKLIESMDIQIYEDVIFLTIFILFTSFLTNVIYL